MKVYRLTVTDNQLDAIDRALESFMRMSIGQFKYSIEEVWRDKVLEVDRRELESICDRLKEMYTGYKDRGASYGIHSKEVQEDARIAWDIKQVIRHRISYDRHPEGGHTVNFNPPNRSSLEPLPGIEKKVDNE